MMKELSMMRYWHYKLIINVNKKMKSGGTNNFMRIIRQNLKIGKNLQFGPISGA